MRNFNYEILKERLAFRFSSSIWLVKIKKKPRTTYKVTYESENSIICYHPPIKVKISGVLLLISWSSVVTRIQIKKLCKNTLSFVYLVCWHDSLSNGMLTSLNYDTSVCWSLIVLASGDVDIPLLLIQSPIPRQVDIKVIVSPPFACHSAQLYSIQLSFSVVWRTGLILTLAQKMFWQPASFSPQRI